MLAFWRSTPFFACDLLVIPISTDYLSLQAAEQMTRTLAILEPVLKRRVERRYLLTRYDRRRKMSQDVQNQLRDRYDKEVCQTMIWENVAIAESPSRKRDVVSHAASSIGAKTIQPCTKAFDYKIFFNCRQRIPTFQD